MTVTPASIKAFAPELTSLDDVTSVQPAIDAAERRTNRTQWGVKADDGVTYLVCHMLTLKNRIAKTGAQARGPLTAQAAGPVSRSFAGPMAVPWTDTWYASTTYGQEFIAIRALVISDRIGDCL